MRGHVAAAVVLGVATAATDGHADERLWSARESVETRYFGDLHDENKPAIVPSPDRRYFFFLSRRGDLAADANVAQLSIFETAQVRRALGMATARQAQPWHTVTLRSTSNHPAIAGAFWTDDSRAIVFSGANDEDIPQIYRLDMRSRALKKLTDAPLGIGNFDVRGETVVYEGWVGKVDSAYRHIQYPADYLSLVQFGQGVFHNPSESRAATFVAVGGAKGRQIGPDFSLYGRSDSSRYWISPDGRRAILRSRILPAEIPSEWEVYRAKILGRSAQVFRLYLLDLQTLQQRVILDAPTVSRFDNARILWSPDSHRVIVSNTALPAEENSHSRGDTLHVIDYDVDDSTWRLVDSRPADEIDPRIGTASASRVPEWLRPGRELLLQHREYLRPPLGWSVHTLKNGRWVGRTVAVPPRRMSTPVKEEMGSVASDGRPLALPGGLTIAIRQSPNDPPMPVATVGGREIQLMPVDARIDDVSRAQVAATECVDSTGERVTGGLLLPTGVRDPRQVPLVIQIYDFLPEAFLPDGYFPGTAYAAQPLASRGFAVFQLDDTAGSGVEQGPALVRHLDTVVECLAARDLIDRTRVGLIGFSNGAYRVDYAITHHDKTRFAAAVSAEGFTASYGYYMAYQLGADGRKSAGRVEGYYEGGLTFWENKQAWMDRAPGFNLDKVRTPLLLTNSSYGIPGYNFLFDMEFYVGLSRLGMPVDFLSFPQGEHPLKRPRERLTSLQTSVDWMAFWLKGEQSEDPNDRGRNERWRQLKANSTKLKRIRKSDFGMLRP